MARVKIKIQSPSPQNKTNLVRILSSHDVYASSIIDVRDGYVVITESIQEIDKIFTSTTFQDLQSHGFAPVLPPEVRTQRNVLLFNLDNHIKDNTEEKIIQEIYNNNEYAENEIDTIFKFPRSRIMKISFKRAETAKKATEQGLKMFHMRVPHYNIKREEYTPVQTCFKCYELESHVTSKCPKARDFMICSECSSEDHTWQRCPSSIKKCINCHGDHRTLAYKCPTRRQIMDEKRQGKNKQPTQSYAAAASTSIPHQPTLSQPDLVCMYQKTIIAFFTAALASDDVPGSFNQKVKQVLQANGIPDFNIPFDLDPSKLFSGPNTNNGTPPPQSTPAPIPTSPIALPLSHICTQTKPTPDAEENEESDGETIGSNSTHEDETTESEDTENENDSSLDDSKAAVSTNQKSPPEYANTKTTPMPTKSNVQPTLNPYTMKTRHNQRTNSPPRLKNNAKALNKHLRTTDSKRNQ